MTDERNGRIAQALLGASPIGQPPQGQTFDPEGSGFDMMAALEAGMRPAGPEAGENEGHFGSVIPTTPQERARNKLPLDSFLILKGKLHPTFDKAVMAEMLRGFEVKKFGDRYFSVPQTPKSVP